MTAETKVIRVGLADDQELFTHGVAMVVNSQDDLAVAWRAANGRQALTCNARDRADVVLMDVQMPELDGIAATSRLLDTSPETRVIMLTTFNWDDYITQGLAAGASGFLLKDTSPEDMLRAIRTVHAGDAVISPQATKRLIEGMRPMLGVDTEPSRDRATRRILDELTPRETEILVAMGKGWSNSEIAARLFISMPTVKTHVSHVLAKTGSRDRVQAVLFAFRQGLVSRRDLLEP